MPVNLQWDTQLNNVIFCHFQENSTWQEYDDTLDKIGMMLGEKDERVDIIFLVESSMPFGNSIAHFRRGQEIISRHAHLHLTVTVNKRAGNLIERLTASVVRMFGLIPQEIFYFANTIQEAHSIIITSRSEGLSLTS